MKAKYVCTYTTEGKYCLVTVEAITYGKKYGFVKLGYSLLCNALNIRRVNAHLAPHKESV